MPRLSFLGAARCVTGSQYLVECGDERLLVDSGMFQGGRELRQHNWDPPPVDPSRVSFIVLTHTHIDHIGRVPRLVKQGFRGRIFCTPATRELAEILLKDAAYLQVEDAEYLNRKSLTRHNPALPLFGPEDVEATLPLFETVPLHERRVLSQSFAFTFQDAGHLLGAASVRLEATEGGQTTRVLFSGDVGRYDTILTKDPEPAVESDYVLVESTYGNRSHARVPVLEQLEAALTRTFARKGVLLIPAFAVGRSQQLLMMMDRLVTEQKMRPFDVHLDSPMAAEATRVYAQFPEAHQPSLSAIGGRSAFHSRHLTVHRTRAESQSLNTMKGPGVIVSSSGMLTGGRILHHCRVRLPHPENTLLITGHQGEGTLGRALLEGARKVRIHKQEIPVLAEIAELRGLSGHADPGELLRWLSAVQKPKKVFLTHGDPEAALALAARLTEERGFPTHVPSLGETVVL